MRGGVQPSARLLFRVDPVPHESPRGYLCRVADQHAYFGPLALAQIAGVPGSALDRERSVRQISRALRLDPQQWRSMCYRPINGRNRFNQRSFCGDRISADDLNYGRPRLCPVCLRERPIWWAVWDLGLVTACPVHRCIFVDQCTNCRRRLAWRRPAVHKCRCGFDLRNVAPDSAPHDLVALTAAVYAAAGFPAGAAAELDVVKCGFPRELCGLKLGPLLRLILFVGSIKERGRTPPEATPFRRYGSDCGN